MRASRTSQSRTGSRIFTACTTKWRSRTKASTTSTISTASVYSPPPRENGYQSVHTVLSCLEGKLIEFQIRTYEMDQIAASGPANHAEYKKAAVTASS